MKKCALSLPVLLFTLLNPTPLLANEHLDYLFGLSLEELLKVKITGSTLTPKELKFVPSTVSVFAHKEIINLGLDTLDELMNLVPGFQSYRSSIFSMHYPFSSRGRQGPIISIRR